MYPEVPEAVREGLETAAWTSAVRSFDVAIALKVDFVLMTGTVLQPEWTGPRGILFLREQFERLQAVGIPVYWKLDEPAASWLLPDKTFPENVFLFPQGETQIRKFRLAEDSRTIFLLSWDGETPDLSRYDLSKLPGEKLPPPLTIALRHEDSGDIPAAYVARGHSERWTRMYTAAFTECVEHSPGTLQGRSPEVLDAGAAPTFGASLVKMDLDGEIPLAVQFVPLETVAWSSLTLEIPSSVRDVPTLAGWLETQFPKTLNVSSEVKQILLYWKLSSDTPAMQVILRQIFRERLEPQRVPEERIGDQLLAQLRRLGEGCTPPIWSVSLEPNGPLLPTDWTQADSVPGDFLRLIRFHQNNPQSVHVPGFTSHKIGLEGYLSEAQQKDELAVLAKVSDGETLQTILRLAEILGADLLHSGESLEGGGA